MAEDEENLGEEEVGRLVGRRRWLERREGWRASERRSVKERTGKRKRQTQDELRLMLDTALMGFERSMKMVPIEKIWTPAHRKERSECQPPQASQVVQAALSNAPDPDMYNMKAFIGKL